MLGSLSLPAVSRAYNSLLYQCGTNCERGPLIKTARKEVLGTPVRRKPNKNFIGMMTSSLLWRPGFHGVYRGRAVLEIHYNEDDAPNFEALDA